MTDPVLVEEIRGHIVESRHRGAAIVVDAEGRTVFSIGDVASPVFPRSAVKLIQALPLVESGAADAFGLAPHELALACASHAGEARHAATALAMLHKAGLDQTALECGAHWPTSHDATVELARSGSSPSALHNNCSGKHAGFLCTCRHLGIDHGGYVRFGHRYQRLIADTMTEVTGVAHGEENSGTDGCSIPTYAVPLTALAAAYARLATGTGLEPRRAAAARRLMQACMAHPFYIAGTGGGDTDMTALGQGRLFMKFGAEGVYCAAIPEMGLGIALKCRDGAKRAAEVAMAAIFRKLLGPSDELTGRLEAFVDQTLRNWNGLDAARLKATPAIS